MLRGYRYFYSPAPEEVKARWRYTSASSGDRQRYIGLLDSPLHKGTYFRLLGARKGKEVGPPPRPHDKDAANSDDELIGIFDEDDEELRPDKSEDEVDQDIIVSTLIYS